MTNNLKTRFFIREAFTGDVYVEVANGGALPESSSYFKSGDIRKKSGREIKKFDSRESALWYIEKNGLLWTEIVEFYE